MLLLMDQVWSSTKKYVLNWLYVFCGGVISGLCAWVGLRTRRLFKQNHPPNPQSTINHCVPSLFKWRQPPNPRHVISRCMPSLSQWRQPPNPRHMISRCMPSLSQWRQPLNPRHMASQLIQNLQPNTAAWFRVISLWRYAVFPLHIFWVVVAFVTTSLDVLYGVFWHYLLVPLRVSWILVSNIQACLVTSLYHLLAKPLLYTFPDLYWTLSGYFHLGMQIYVASFMRIAGFKVAVAGTDMRQHSNQRCLLLPNHKAPVDAAMVVWTMLRSLEGAHSAMWVFSSMFKNTYFGWTCRLQGDFPIHEGKTQEQREKEQNRLTLFLRKWFVPIPQKRWIILFPEGGFLHNRKNKSQEYARKHNYPLLEHVALPRIGATKAVLDALSPQTLVWSQKHHMLLDKPQPAPLAWVADVTIAYPGGKVVSLWELLTARVPTSPVILCYRTFPASQVPLSRSGLTHWMNDRFTEKDMMLEHYYNTGEVSLVLPTDNDSEDENEDTDSSHVTIKPDVIPCASVSVRQVATTFVGFTVVLLIELRIIYRLYRLMFVTPFIVMSILSVL